MKKSEATSGAKAVFPICMTILSFLLFVAVYAVFITKSVDPRYFGNLVFAVPFVFFGLTSLFTRTGKIRADTSSALTIILIIVLGIAMLFMFGFRVLQESTTTTTDVTRYERVLRITGYPKKPMSKYFPAQIPEGAENVLFSYIPGFGQGGENIDLKFNTDQDSIRSYNTAFSRLAQWEGKAGSPEAERNGIFLGTFSVFGYPQLPNDFTIYLFDGNPYQPGNWNHGRLSLAAVSSRCNEIIFHSEIW